MSAGLRRACSCESSDPVMQADGRFYCYTCSFETGARPNALYPEQEITRLRAEVEQLTKAVAAPALRARAEALLSAITPGEWHTDERGVVARDSRFNPHGRRRIATCVKTTSYPQPDLDTSNNANAEFIAAAPQLVRDLLAALVLLKQSDDD